MTTETARLRFSRDDPRVRTWNDAPVRSRGEFVLYWMQMYRRPEDNAALAYAIIRANELGVRCLVYEALRPDYPFASDRFHTFILESARDVAAGLARRGLQHAFFLPRTRDEARGVLSKIAARASLVVTDEFPSFIVPDQTASLARRVDCPVLSVDDCAVVPLALFPREEIGARTIRPKLNRFLATWLVPLDEPEPSIPAREPIELPFDPLPLSGAPATAALVASCTIDHGVGPVAEFPGGAVAAAARARAFTTGALRHYAEDRNDPSRRGTSELSPYLHFGMISARRVALAAREAAPNPTDDSAAAFLEQLLVRRGLAFNFARSNSLHRSFDALPLWARRTLAEHAPDTRPSEVSLQELADGGSPDALWNAAQLELRARGVVHGYARMLWGKLPLLWMKDPRDVHAALVTLNDRFALDGRDPDGYGNISWCFGLHDRPWPSRFVYGAVRCMTSKSARKKLDFESYIDAGRALRRDLGLPTPPREDDYESP